MGRGLPALLSFLVSLLFAGGGGILIYLQQQNVRPDVITIPASDYHLFGIPLVAFGLFLFIIGLYVQFATPPEPSLRNGEDLIDERNPSQRVAISEIVVSIPLLAITAYLLFFTSLAYLYPTITLLVGLYFLSSGIKTYWVNALTTYYVTTRRVITEYQFISQMRQEIPMDKIRGIEERKSIKEALVGIGNIRVASGGGGGSVELVIRNIREQSSFANELRDIMDSV